MLPGTFTSGQQEREKMRGKGEEVQSSAAEGEKKKQQKKHHYRERERENFTGRRNTSDRFLSLFPHPSLRHLSGLRERE